MKKSILILIIVLALIVGVSIGYGYGFTKGSYKTMVWGLSIAKNYMNITFNEEDFAAGIFQWENRIGGCLNTTYPKILE